MLKQLEANIQKNGLFGKEDRVLLAFSGGVDSVVLAHLLHEGGFNVTLAHCNFQLRGQEAEKDTAFTAEFAQRLGLRFFTNYFDTTAYAQEHKLSVQMAARKLRYDWFQDLCDVQGFDRIATAHHASDNTETILINLVRGTGIKGMSGIPAQQQRIVRPLLFATKEEIRTYADKQKLPYREDGSNAEVKYKRNFIRHRVVPALQTLNPALDETICTSTTFFRQSAQIVQAYAQSRYASICSAENGLLRINIGLLKNEPFKETLLFEWLYQKHFRPRQIAQLCDVLDNGEQPGKQFSSHSHRLVVDRRDIIVQALAAMAVPGSYTIREPEDTAHLPFPLRIEEVGRPATLHMLPNEILLPYTDRLFPLRLRRWQEGDKFRPFGMQGFKKLSDFFKDRKLSLFEKEAVWILESPEHIIWVVGHRLDDRCRINEHTDRLLRISVS